MESFLHIRRSTSDRSEAYLTHQPLKLGLISLLCQVPWAHSAEPQQCEHWQRFGAAKATGFTWGTPGSDSDAEFQARLKTLSLTLFSLLSGCVKGRHIQREENWVQRDALGILPLLACHPWLQRLVETNPWVPSISTGRKWKDSGLGPLAAIILQWITETIVCISWDFFVYFWRHQASRCFSDVQTMFCGNSWSCLWACNRRRFATTGSPSPRVTST